MHSIFPITSGIDAGEGYCKIKKISVTTGENTATEQRRKLSLHFSQISHAEASSQVLPAASLWLTPATDAPELR